MRVLSDEAFERLIVFTYTYAYDISVNDLRWSQLLGSFLMAQLPGELCAVALQNRSAV